jgi:hypothetical protein
MFLRASPVEADENCGQDGDAIWFRLSNIIIAQERGLKIEYHSRWEDN